MFNDLYTGLFLLLPIVVGGVLHMLVLTHEWVPALKIPVYPAWFGANKTWHGFIVMPLVTILGVLFAQALERTLGPVAFINVTLLPYSAVLLGVLLGFGYIFFELPNSWLKRRLGIPPGATPKRHRVVFILLDQLDSAVGFVLVYYCWIDISVSVALTMLVIFPGVALSVKRILYWTKLKKHYT